MLANIGMLVNISMLANNYMLGSICMLANVGMLANVCLLANHLVYCCYHALGCTLEEYVVLNISFTYNETQYILG